MFMKRQYKIMKIRIINYLINNISLSNLLNRVLNWKKDKKAHYICVSNVHQCIEAYNNKEFAKVINGADIAIPDGRPIYWALRLLKNNDAEQLPSFYTTKAICKFASENDLKIGFYGGETKSLERCVFNLNNIK